MNFRPTLCIYRLNLTGKGWWDEWEWHCPPDTVFEIRALTFWGWARYLLATGIGSPQYWIFASEQGINISLFETWMPELGANPRSPTFQYIQYNIKWCCIFYLFKCIFSIWPDPFLWTLQRANIWKRLLHSESIICSYAPYMMAIILHGAIDLILRCRRILIQEGNSFGRRKISQGISNLAQMISDRNICPGLFWERWTSNDPGDQTGIPDNLLWSAVDLKRFTLLDPCFAGYYTNSYIDHLECWYAPYMMANITCWVNVVDVSPTPSKQRAIWWPN